MAEWRDPSEEQIRVRPRPSMQPPESTGESKFSPRKGEFLIAVLISFITAVVTAIGVGRFRNDDTSSLRAMAATFQQVSIDVKRLQREVEQVQVDLQRMEDAIQKANNRLKSDEDRLAVLEDYASSGSKPGPSRQSAKEAARPHLP